MSLTQLLSLGKKAEEAKPEPKVEKKEPAPPPAAPRVKNEDEMKVLQEFTQTQSKLSQEEAERRQAEEEKLKKQAIDDAAKAAAELAKRQRTMQVPSNPFSTGGQEFTKGVFVCDTVFGTNTPKGARSTMQDYGFFGPGVSPAWPGLPPGQSLRPSMPSGSMASSRERSRSPKRGDSEAGWGGGSSGWPSDPWGGWPGGFPMGPGKGGGYGPDGPGWGGGWGKDGWGGPCGGGGKDAYSASGGWWGGGGSGSSGSGMGGWGDDPWGKVP